MAMGMPGRPFEQRSRSTDALHGSQVNMQSLHARCLSLETLSRGALEAQGRHETWCRATQGQVEQLKAHLTHQEEQRAGLKGQLVDLVTKCREQLSTQQLQLQEKTDRLTVRTNQSAHSVAQEVEALHKAIAQTASFAETSEKRGLMLEGRLSELENALGDRLTRHRAVEDQRFASIDGRLQAMVSDQTHALQAMHEKLEQLRDHLRGQLQGQHSVMRAELARAQAAQDQAVAVVGEQLAAEVRTRDALEKAVQFHLAREKQSRSDLEELCHGLTEDLKVAQQACREGLTNEAAARTGSQEALREQLGREQSARRSLEDQLVQEKSDRFRQAERLYERLEALDRGRASSPLRRELQARLSRQSNQSTPNLRGPTAAKSGLGGSSPEQKRTPSNDAILGRFVLNDALESDRELGTNRSTGLSLQRGQALFSDGW